MIAAKNSRVVAYDNLSGIPQWLSDALCRLATGGGFSTRELYTDTEEVILDLTRPVILNGIDHLAERPDLADRAIILQLPRIEEEARQDEEQLYAWYERDRPQILGALFTALSGALARLPTVKLVRKPRMADFALWATAAEKGLGFESGAFMTAYAANRAESVNETLESDPVSTAILVLFDDATSEWTGTAGDLMKHLEQTIEDGIKKSPAWPKTPRAFSSRLRRLTTFLRESGIEITFHKRKGTRGQRLLTIARTALDLTASTATTASAETVSSTNHRPPAYSASGGRNPEVADEPHRGDQRPLQASPDIQLNGQGFPQRTAEVAVEAVVCVASLAESGPPDRIDFCAQCGPAEWQWNGTNWICGCCGTPAPKSECAGESAAAVDSAGTEEQPMSRAEAPVE